MSNAMIGAVSIAVAILALVGILTLASYLSLMPDPKGKRYCAICGADASFTIGDKFFCMRCWKRALRERAS